MNWNWKWFCSASLLGLLTFGAAGCGGISASRSVSPLDFLLPGLIKNETPAPHQPSPASPPGQLLAQN